MKIQIEHNICYHLSVTIITSTQRKLRRKYIASLQVQALFLTLQHRAINARRAHFRCYKYEARYAIACPQIEKHSNDKDVY